MATTWDLERYVSGHPDDHAQRWRLAKKLYKECEYRVALEHLLTLKEEWTPKVNVLRYLAATYYRLGRNSEALAELEAAIEEWPSEIGLREQLAGVLETCGRRQDAAKVWDQIAEIAPDHAMASRAARRLYGGTSAPAYEGMSASELESGIDLGEVQVCPHCGAQNDAELERCWQCHAVLGQRITPLPTPSPGKDALPKIDSRVWPAVSAVSIGGLLAAGAFLSIQRVIEANLVFPELRVYTTIQDTLAGTLVTTRALVGVMTLIVWPIALRLAVRAAHVSKATPVRIIHTGLFLAALAYLATWAPVILAAFTPILMLIISLVAIIAVFRPSVKAAVIAWLLQAVIVTAAVLACLIALEGFRPIKECLAVVRYGVLHDAQEAPGVYRTGPVKTPIDLAIRWDSTGSSWLDEHADVVQFEVRAQEVDPPMVIEFKDETRPYLYDDLDRLPFVFSRRIIANRDYHLLVTGREGVEVSIILRGTLRAQINP